jgi:hypothetical protein
MPVYAGRLRLPTKALRRSRYRSQYHPRRTSRRSLFRVSCARMQTGLKPTRFASDITLGSGQSEFSTRKGRQA